MLNLALALIQNKKSNLQGVLVITFKNITKSYGQNQHNVLNNFCADFKQNRICILGPNGSGKSTLLLCLSGLLPVDTGTIYLAGNRASLVKRKQMCALASDSIVIPEFLSANQVIELNQKTYATAWPEKLIDEFGIRPHLHKSIDTLSAGNLKKLQLITAFMRSCEFLLLDEPNIALDEKSVTALNKCMDEFLGTIVVASNEPRIFAQLGFALIDLHQKN